MATEALKSPSITNDTANPTVQNTAGKGAPARLNMSDDYVTTTSGVTVGSTYRMVRLPTTAKVKRITWEAGAMTQGPFDVGVYYSIGNPASLTGAVVDADFFASAVSAASAVVAGTEITNESGTYTLDKRGMPLWQAVGASSDPGGNYDIVFTSTNTITAGALLGVRVEWDLD